MERSALRETNINPSSYCLRSVYDVLNMVRGSMKRVNRVGIQRRSASTLRRNFFSY